MHCPLAVAPRAFSASRFWEPSPLAYFLWGQGCTAGSVASNLLSWQFCANSAGDVDTPGSAVLSHERSRLHGQARHPGALPQVRGNAFGAPRIAAHPCVFACLQDQCSSAHELHSMLTWVCRCSSWGQTQTVLDFFNQPAKSQRGLPARPVVGCAVSCKLDLPAAVIEEWFN